MNDVTTVVVQYVTEWRPEMSTQLLNPTQRDT